MHLYLRSNGSEEEVTTADTSLSHSDEKVTLSSHSNPTEMMHTGNRGLIGKETGTKIAATSNKCVLLSQETTASSETDITQIMNIIQNKQLQ